jgi:hypothetical protein
MPAEEATELESSENPQAGKPALLVAGASTFFFQKSEHKRT